MAFLKHASGVLVHRNFTPESWGNFLGRNQDKLVTVGPRTASGSPNLVTQASEILGETFDPDRYLLTHATIVASVDTEDVPNVKLGGVTEQGRKITRKWSNYRVTPETEHWINNNHDSWDRPVLLKSYRTFVGAHNFIEHVQLEEQSRGRIIDAVARDIGPSVYTDILIATDRKHTSLIRDIESGKMGTLSMGCSVESTACTKCGNVAVDETQMCPCVKYEKGNSFFDERGVRRRVAELCGHHSLTPTGGVTFIEASWVAVPAFQGAVMRNILKPEVLSLETRRRAGRVLASAPPQWDGSKRQKAARIRTPSTWPRTDVCALTRLGQFEPPGEDDAGDKGKEEANPLESLEVEVEQFLLNKVRERIRNKLKEDVAEEASSGELTTSNEDNIVHQGSLRASLAEGTNALVRIARSDIELVDGLARLHADLDVNIRREIYRTVLRVGSTTNRSLDEYLARCAKALGRRITAGEAKTLVRLGRILSMWKRTQS